MQLDANSFENALHNFRGYNVILLFGNIQVANLFEFPIEIYIFIPDIWNRNNTHLNNTTSKCIQATWNSWTLCT